MINQRFPRHLLYQHWEKEKKASFAELTEELPARSDTEQQALHKVELSEVLEALNRLPVDVAQVVNTFVVTMHGKVNMKYEKVEKVMTGLSLGAIVYALFWYCFMMISAGDGNVPLGFELGQVGPFLHLHTGIALAVEIAVFAYTMVRYMKRDIVCRGTLLISLTGLFFILAQTTLLGSLSELETHMRDFTEAAVVILGAGAACGLVLWGTEKFRRKQNGLR